jgi:DNA-binding beta-propeller fold protein YncE
VTPTVLASGQLDPYGIALDPQGQFVYWTNYVGGTVMKTRADGSGPVVTVASQQNAPAAISVDDAYVYWGAGTAIYKIAK